MSYERMAQQLGIEWCGGIRPTGHTCYEEHRLNGSVKGRTVHFADRPVTALSTIVFLKLAAQVIDPTLADETAPWRRVYRAHLIVRACSRRLHVRLPARYFGADRAFVLAGVAGLPNSVPMRRQAFDWARRGPK